MDDKKDLTYDDMVRLLERLMKLKEEGALTEEEFQKEKAKLLSKSFKSGISSSIPNDNDSFSKYSQDELKKYKIDIKSSKNETKGSAADQDAECCGKGCGILILIIAVLYLISLLFGGKG